ncbi:hypothetical protein Tco_0110945 [Tanacetum coccineum]
MLLNVDQLQKQLDKDEFQEDGSMTAFWVVNNQFQKFIDSKFTLDYDSQMTDTYFVEYTGIEVQHFRDTLLQHLGNVKKSVAERTRHQRQTDSIVQDDSSRSGNDTDADDADIRPIYDEEPMAEVQLTAECNIFAIGQQHTEQPKIIVEGRVDEYIETCQVKSPMLDSSPDSQTRKGFAIAALKNNCCYVRREMITSQLQGKLRLYDEVRARTLFVLSSSNRGRLLGIIDLMRQKNKRMKQEGLNRQIGKLQDVT